MLTFCLNEQATSYDFEAGFQARLLFICKAEGAEAAIPRVMHKHDERFELLFIRQGKGFYNIDGRRYQVKRGDLLVFNAGVLHDEHPQASEDLLIYSCGVEGLKLQGLPVNHLTELSQIAVVPSGESYAEICTLFDQMWHHTSKRKPMAAQIGHNLLNVLLIISRNIWNDNRQESISPQDVLAKKIKDYIDCHYKNEIVFNTITAELNITRFHLAGVFKSFSGYSPKQYQTRRRIGEAQSLLLSTDLGIADVANAVGYENVNNFHRIFNNMVGIPPARYKKFWLASA